MSTPPITSMDPAAVTDAAPAPTAVLETRNFINQLSDYQSLSKCAEGQVSSIVRNMAFGCGDGGRMTSFGCFCMTSSSEYDSMIGAHVRTACRSGAATEETKARSLFDAYCHIPITAEQDGDGATAVATMATVTRSATLSSSMRRTNSPSALAQSATPGSNFPRTAIIALSVALPLLALALAALVYLLFSRKRKNAPQAMPSELQGAQAAELSAHALVVPETEKAPPYQAYDVPVAASPVAVSPATPSSASPYPVSDRKGGRGAVELDGSDMVFRDETDMVFRGEKS